MMSADGLSMCVYMPMRPLLIASLCLRPSSVSPIILLRDRGSHAVVITDARENKILRARAWRSLENEMSLRGDLTRLIDPLCLIIIARLLYRLRARHFAASVSTARLNPNCFPEIDYGRCNSAAALNFYYRMRFRVELTLFLFRVGSALKMYTRIILTWYHTRICLSHKM